MKAKPTGPIDPARIRSLATGIGSTARSSRATGAKRTAQVTQPVQQVRARPVLEKG